MILVFSLGQVPYLTVLAVDSDPGVLNIFSAILRSDGYTVASASSPDEAMAAIRGGIKPDLLLTGMVFQGTDGVALAHRIRAEVPGLPVVLATTGAQEFAGNLIAEGIQVLLKPFPSATLRNAVRRALADPPGL